MDNSIMKEQNKNIQNPDQELWDRAAIDKIRKKLEKNLSAKRYQHTLGVAYTAACLAMRWQADPVRAEIAGLLHDCAKEYGEKELLSLGETFGITFSDAERAAPQVLHAVVGPGVAQRKYGVRDADILSAIRWHTTGKADMTLLEQIVFTADYIEPNRDRASDLDEMRALAFQDLDECVYRITDHTLAYLEQKGIPADPMTEQCYLWLKEKKDDNSGTGENCSQCDGREAGIRNQSH